MLSENFARPDNVPPSVADIYTELDTTRLQQVSVEEDLRLYMRQADREKRISVQEMADGEQRLLILGDPGSGKSTFAKHMAYLLALAGGVDPVALERLQPWSHGSLLPVYIELRDVAAFAVEQKIAEGSVRLFERYLAGLLEQWGCADSWPALREALQGEKTRAILLLDGLDEVSTNQRKLLVETVNALAADRVYRRHRCIVTSRPYAYYDVSREQRLRGFAEVMLAAFSPEQVDHFVDNWYKRLADGPSPSFTRAEVDKRRADLKAAVRRPDHRSLAQRPILLTMMVQLHTFTGDLPRDRINLYKESVDLLLARWNTKNHGLPSLREYLALPDLKDKEVEKALAHVAFRAHAGAAAEDDGSDVLGGAARDGERTADIGEQDLQHWVQPYLGGSQEKAALFIQYIRERAGLLVRHKTAAYTFPHRSIQEYLAARHLVTADDQDYKEVAPALVQGDAVRWREVFVLAAGCADRASDAVAAINGLCPRDWPGGTAAIPAEQWIRAQIGGEALLELGESVVKRTAAGPAVWERVQGWLLACMRQQGDGPKARTRAQAGQILAKLGDPRIEVLDPLRMEFCLVPAGRFVMGTGYSERQCKYNIPYTYWMSRYPVTVAQYSAFLVAGGYNESRFWREAQIENLWRDGRYKDRDAPYQINDLYDLPNHPVVGVSWYEALAFVRWLDEVSVKPSGSKLVLPSEPEWEKAARGGLHVVEQPLVVQLNRLGTGNVHLPLCPNKMPERGYPWAYMPNSDYANYIDTEIGSTTSVGCFSGGASPYGVEDMSGNVWEWTRSLFGDYPYPFGGVRLADREDLEASSDLDRVLRGGAFFYFSEHAECTSRYRYRPQYELMYNGFRVVCFPSVSVI